MGGTGSEVLGIGPSSSSSSISDRSCDCCLDNTGCLVGALTLSTDDDETMFSELLLDTPPEGRGWSFLSSLRRRASSKQL